MILALLIGCAAYAETSAVLPLPCAADVFGEAVDSGYVSVYSDFSGSYDMYSCLLLSVFEEYNAQMEALGYLGVEGELNGIDLWMYYWEGEPAVLFARANGQAILCDRDGFTFREEGADAPRSAESVDPTDIRDLSSVFFGETVTEGQTVCFSCGGTGICPLCSGTGVYKNYGQEVVCAACTGTGVCGICDGKGSY
jgi:hypothetical protein